MEKLRKVIDQHGRWAPLQIYVDRIETYFETDFSSALENAKALLETIGKEICSNKGIRLNDTIKTGPVLKKAFHAIGFPSEAIVTQISTGLANIGEQMAILRNQFGTTAHGRPLHEIQERNKQFDELTKEFLLGAAETTACFLIKTFEMENPRINASDLIKVSYETNQDFNEEWDDLYGEFKMGEFSFWASEILYNMDPKAYKDGLEGFSQDVNDTEER